MSRSIFFRRRCACPLQCVALLKPRESLPRAVAAAESGEVDLQSAHFGIGEDCEERVGVISNTAEERAGRVFLCKRVHPDVRSM